MSRFRNEVHHLQAHVRTLRLGAGALFVVALLLGFGWWSAPRQLTIHVPPDLRSGSTRAWWDVPPENVYAFAFYVWQQVQRWPTDGEQDYPRNLHALSAYFTPCAWSWHYSAIFSPSPSKNGAWACPSIPSLKFAARLPEQAAIVG